MAPVTLTTTNVMVMKMIVVLSFLMIISSAMPLAHAVRGSDTVDIRQLRRQAARTNVTCILVFGDSSVDPGNNNCLKTTFKGNFAPYGKDFFNGKPTGRFCNGRLTTDFIADAFGFTKIVPGFLQPNLTKEQLLHGISFASAASGYDDLTSNLTNVLPVSKQLEYLKHYKIKLVGLVGQKKAAEIIGNAIFILSMGTNDFIQNYFLEPIRPKQYTLDHYQDYLVSCMIKDIKEMQKIGATRLVAVGIPPLGCMPLVKTLTSETKGCSGSYNNVSFSFNKKARDALANIDKSGLGMKTAFVDAYAMIQNAMNNPTKYGFTETSKGCCGTGTVEFGDSCKGMSTCKDPSKYVFWDAVHPTERMYRIIADEALKSVSSKILI